MTIKELSQYITDEDKAEDYLRDKKILKEFSQCPGCGSSHFGRVRRQRFKCYECKYEWNVRKESVLESSHLSLSDFIGCIKMFADEFTASKCAYELCINRIRVGRLYRKFQKKLIGQINIPTVNSKIMKISLKLEDGKIHVALDDNDSAEDSSRLIISRSKNQDGAYQYLISYENLRIKRLLRAIDRIDELDDFYRYCQERLLTFRNRDENKLIWKLHELAFRYNHRHEDIYNLLLTKLSKYSIPG